MNGKLNNRATVSIPVNLSGAGIGAAQTSLFGKKSKGGTVNAQRATKEFLCCALRIELKK